MVIPLIPTLYGARDVYKRQILTVAKFTKQPVYLSIDDTVVAKKKASKHAVRPTEGVGWHYSHSVTP